jgi:hypothetical protein
MNTPETTHEYATKQYLHAPAHGPAPARENARQGGYPGGLPRRILEKLGDPQAAPAKASGYLLYYPKIARPGLRVVVYLRVSSRDQYRKRKMRSQERWVLMMLRKAGADVRGIYREVGSGWSACLDQLTAAAEFAASQGAVLVAESACRFLRSILFKHDATDPIQPHTHEWEKLRTKTNGVTLATLLHPDMHWREVRGHQRKRGRGVRCTAGQKKRQREKLLPEVLKLRWWDHSYREIQGQTSVPWRTVRDWIKKYA